MYLNANGNFSTKFTTWLYTLTVILNKTVKEETLLLMKSLMTGEDSMLISVRNVKLN